MAVFRVEKNHNYTVMANYHLKDNRLSLKAKGLMSVMLSLPDDWDYTLRGLACICKEGVDAIREAIRELERAGYILRSRERNEKGQMKNAEYLNLSPHQLSRVTNVDPGEGLIFYENAIVPFENHIPKELDL